MRDGTPSPSALRVAALRALHQTQDVPPVFVDPLAERILGPDAADLIATYRASAATTARLRGTLAARTLVAEATIASAAARGVTQCIIFGAGLDTFPYRQRHERLTVFEVDHPATQGWKQGLLRHAGIDVPATVRHVALDLERDDPIAALTVAGFDPARPAVGTLLGLTPYLARETTFGLLGRLGAAGHVEIVLDYTEPYQDAPPAIRAIYEAIAARLARDGEPWITMFEPASLHRALHDLGFANVTDLDATALQHRFLAGRTDALTIAPLVHLLQAGSRT